MVMVIPIINSALGTVSKGLENEQGELDIRKRMEIIQTIAWLKLLKYGEASWRTEEIAVTQTSMKFHRLTLVRTRKEWNNNEVLKENKNKTEIRSTNAGENFQRVK